ncbi:Cilia- and flagella-associated protein 74 [Diplonema papillatum]|nr:Cilia- and flagella-associated protein 74 [Diplonema papillatum]
MPDIGLREAGYLPRTSDTWPRSPSSSEGLRAWEPGNTYSFRYDEVYLAPRTTRIITVDYTAAVVGDVDTSVVVHFNDHTTRDVIIRITASGTEPPVCVEEGSDIIDFRCCITDGLYRDQLTVRNRGKSSIKVTPTIPAALKAYLEYSPKFGFVQPRGKLSYQIKFRPSKALLRQIAGGGNGNGVLDQKIRIEVLGQLYPVHYQLKAILTVADLRLSSSFLDFRTCVDGEAVSRELRVKNEGNMPVEMGMLDVPPEVKVSPRLGFACIQPNAEKMFVVTFRRAAGAVKASSGSLQLTAGATPVEGEWRGRLLVKNERGGEYPVQLIAACVRPVLELSASLLKLPATALGDRRDATVLLTNRTNAKQTYRFCTDSTARVGIVISPACGIVEAKSSEPLLVTFGPDVLLDVFSPPFETSPDARCPSYHADIFSSCIIKDQPQSSIALQVRVCVVLPTLLAEPTAPPATPSTTPVPPESPVKSGKTATKDNKLALPKSSKDMRHSAPPTPKAPLVKEARTPLPPPPSHDEPRAFVARLRSDNNLRCVHFGVAPAFQSVTRTFHLRNTGAEPCVFTVQLLDPYGPFTVAKPPALPVNPGSYCAVAVTFRPVAEASYREELVATAAAAVSTSIVPTGALNNVHVTLQGRGLAPALTAALDGTPTENPSFVVVPMGDCVAQNVLIKHGVADLPTEARRRELKLLNSCSFAVPFKVSFVPSTAHPLNHSGSNPFSVVPQMGEVPASGHTVLSLVFAPDHSFEGYRAEAVCEYGGLEQRIKLCFSGSAWPRSLYLKCPSALTSSSRVTTTDDARIAPDPLLIDETLTSLALDFESDDTPLAPAEQPRYQLDFHPDIAADKRVVREAQRTVFVGNMKGSDARMAAPSEVSIDPKQLADAEALGFKISGLTGGKLALPAGAPEAKFEVTFSGKDASGFVAPDIFNQLPVPGVSIDVETTLALSLKGGWPPQPEGATAFLLLKGSIKIPTQ